MSDQREDRQEQPPRTPLSEVAPPENEPKADAPAPNGPDKGESEKTYQRFTPELMDIARAFGPRKPHLKKKKS